MSSVYTIQTASQRAPSVRGSDSDNKRVRARRRFVALSWHEAYHCFSTTGAQDVPSSRRSDEDACVAIRVWDRSPRRSRKWLNTPRIRYQAP